MSLKGSVPLIDPVSRKLLHEELTTDRLVRPTRIGSNEVYIFTAHKAPNLMQEVGRLRELTFRDAGAGFGTAVDIDHFDYWQSDLLLKLQSKLHPLMTLQALKQVITPKQILFRFYFSFYRNPKFLACADITIVSLK